MNMFRDSLGLHPYRRNELAWLGLPWHPPAPMHIQCGSSQRKTCIVRQKLWPPNERPSTQAITFMYWALPLDSFKQFCPYVFAPSGKIYAEYQWLLESNFKQAFVFAPSTRLQSLTPNELWNLYAGEHSTYRRTCYPNGRRRDGTDHGCADPATAATCILPSSRTTRAQQSRPRSSKLQTPPTTPGPASRSASRGRDESRLSLVRGKRQISPATTDEKSRPMDWSSDGEYRDSGSSAGSSDESESFPDSWSAGPERKKAKIAHLHTTTDHVEHSLSDGSQAGRRPKGKHRAEHRDTDLKVATPSASDPNGDRGSTSKKKGKGRAGPERKSAQVDRHVDSSSSDHPQSNCKIKIAQRAESVQINNSCATRGDTVPNDRPQLSNKVKGKQPHISQPVHTSLSPPKDGDPRSSGCSRRSDKANGNHKAGPCDEGVTTTNPVVKLDSDSYTEIPPTSPPQTKRLPRNQQTAQAKRGKPEPGRGRAPTRWNDQSAASLLSPYAPNGIVASSSRAAGESHSQRGSSSTTRDVLNKRGVNMQKQRTWGPRNRRGRGHGNRD